MKELKIVPKILDKSYLSANGKTFIPIDRELIVESDMQNPSDRDSIVYRFKIGNGISPYSDLQYISSLYGLFPKILLCDSKYENCLTIALEEDR